MRMSVQVLSGARRKGHRTSALLGSFPVGPKTGVNLMLVQNSFAEVVILGRRRRMVKLVLVSRKPLEVVAPPLWQSNNL